MQVALLLIAHGSRHAEANADLVYLAGRLKERGWEIVEAAFLELAEPDILEGGMRCVERGAGRVVLTPCFLSAGVHVQRDLTTACSELARRYPGVDFRLAEPVGRHPLLADILAERARQALTS